MLAEAESDRLVGLVVGGAYQLVGRIGEGGMGAVYEAHHLRLQKRVAVKLMSRAMVRNPDALARFHREARIASRLGHPNLVNVLDFGSLEEGQPYLVMEYLEGEDLDRRIRRVGSVPMANAIQIARQVASALAVVHAKGIVHRDLKPANVFLVQVPGEPDFVKVLDFGVSKIKAARTKLTDAYTVVGTPEYMSPEQASGLGGDIDHRADQWALACIVWEMLSGRTPFAADDTDAVFYQLANLSPPPLAKHAPDLPAAIESVLLRALSKRAPDRYSSMREFARALEMAALGSCSRLTPVPLEQAKTIAACQALASSDAGSDVVLGGHPGRRRGSKVRAALAAAAVVLVFTAGGVLFAAARSGGAAVKATQQALVASVPVVRARPAATAVEPNKQPLVGTLDAPDTLAKGSANFLDRTSTSRVRASKSRYGRPGRRSPARPVGTRLMFEDL
jgi:tRNA A-37 threonylcarbamoyl transferase component Bud32